MKQITPPAANVTCTGDPTYVPEAELLRRRIDLACTYLDTLRLRGGANARQLAKVRHFLETGVKQW